MHSFINSFIESSCKHSPRWLLVTGVFSPNHEDTAQLSGACKRCMQTAESIVKWICSVKEFSSWFSAVFQRIDYQRGCLYSTAPAHWLRTKGCCQYPLGNLCALLHLVTWWVPTPVHWCMGIGLFLPPDQSLWTISYLWSIYSIL